MKNIFWNVFLEEKKHIFRNVFSKNIFQKYILKNIFQNIN